MIYNFVCHSCGLTREHNVPMEQRDTAIFRCPKCDVIMRVEISVPTVIFKGSFPGKDMKK